MGTPFQSPIGITSFADNVLRRKNDRFRSELRVRAGDFERALEISIANVESCQPDPTTDVTERDVAAAHYNVGILYRIRGDFDSAKLSLEQALATDPDNGVVRRAIGETLSAEAAAAGLSRAGRIRRFRRRP